MSHSKNFPMYLIPSQLQETLTHLQSQLPMTALKQLQLETATFGSLASASSAAASTTSSSAREQAIARSLAARGISFPASAAKHPQYARMEVRLRSFGDWPHEQHASSPSLAYVAATPFTLALEGFFQPEEKGSADTCVCFACGLTLHNWDRTDVPTTEHISKSSDHASSKCPLLLYREKSKVNPTAIAIEQGLIRYVKPGGGGSSLSSVPPILPGLTGSDLTAAREAIMKERLANLAALRSSHPAYSAMRSSTSTTKSSTTSTSKTVDHTDPVCLPIPSDQISAAVYTTPITPSRPPVVANSNTTYGSFGITYPPSPMSYLSSSTSSTNATPLSTMDRMRHLHLKRSRSLFSLNTYGDPTIAPIDDSNSIETEEFLALNLSDARAIHALLSEKCEHLNKKRKTTTTGTATSDSSSNTAATPSANAPSTTTSMSDDVSGSSDSESGYQTQIESALHHLESKIKRLEFLQRESLDRINQLVDQHQPSSNESSSSSTATSKRRLSKPSMMSHSTLKTPTTNTTKPQISSSSSTTTSSTKPSSGISAGLARTIFIQEIATAMLIE